MTSGQFAYVYKLKANDGGAFAVRCFRGFLGDREARYKAIDEHLEKHRSHALASFDYDIEGILIGGKWFPILVMEWVDGPTLDVYLEQVIDKPDVIKHIAEQWLNLISDLRVANIAHGDLQHGNIIVERGRLRLVDLDGMYVPEMKGWEASEVGHQHYQHPKRDEKFFNSYLDNFSALVIYLSLISIAEKPSLWKKYHDENLLFIKNDFLAPEKSPLFREIKEISAEHRRLAEVLEQAAKDSPFLTPSLLELVEVNEESNLPLWMTAPLEIDVAAKTREDKTIVIPRPQQKGMPSWTPWQTNDPSLMPSGIGSNTVQTIFGSAAATPADPKAVFSNTFFYANEIVGKKIDFAVVAFATVIWFGSMCFSPWAFFVVPLLASSLLLVAGFVKAMETRNAVQPMQLVPTPNQGLVQTPQTFGQLFWGAFKEGLISVNHGIVSILTTFITVVVVAVFLGYGFVIALAVILLFAHLLSAYGNAKAEYRKQQNALQSNAQASLSPSNVQTNPLPFYQQKYLSNANTSSTILTPSTQTQPTPISPLVIGNAMFGIYHKHDCEWVMKIPPGRRVMFDSVEDAEDKDYNACHICFPKEEPKKKEAVSTTKKPDNKTSTSSQNVSVSSSSSSETQQPAPKPELPKPVVMFVGNRLLGIYHKPDCEWAKKIPQGKRMNFYSEDEAKNEKYRRCHVCS